MRQRRWVRTNCARSAAGSRTMIGLLDGEGTTVGRFTLRRLMRELGLNSKQPGPPRYRSATVARPDNPNHLDRQLDVFRPNRVWCGDTTYIGAQGPHNGNIWRWCWTYTRGVWWVWRFSTRPDAALVTRTLEHAYEQPGKPPGLLFHSDQGSEYARREFRQRL